MYAPYCRKLKNCIEILVRQTILISYPVKHCFVYNSRTAWPILKI